MYTGIQPSGKQSHESQLDKLFVLNTSLKCQLIYKHETHSNDRQLIMDTSRVPTKPATKLLHKTELGSQPPHCISQAHPITYSITAKVSTKLNLLQSQMTVTANAKA